MKNYIQKGEVLELTCAYPASPTSGCMALIGSYITGVAVANMGAGGAASTKTMVQVGGGVFDLLVATSGAIVVGDALFLHGASPCVLNNVSASGVFFGYALEAIASGSDTINVRHVPSPGAGTLGAGTVGTTELAANGVTAAKLTATMRKGFIPLDIFNARVIGTDAIAAVVGAATDPILKRFNGATDKAASISWESASVIEIQLGSVCYPPDLDDAADVEVHLLAKMLAGSVNMPVLTVSAWEGEGDSNMGSASAALSTTMQDLTVTLATANIAARPNCLNIGITPGAHATASNDIRLYGAWIEYTRK